VAGFSFVDPAKGQYTDCESRRILEFYRAWVNTIPSGNKPAAHYENGSKCPDHLIKAPSLWQGMVLCHLLYSRSQGSNNPVPEILMRFPGPSCLVVDVRAATFRATPETTVYHVATLWAGDMN
jgi:hypothetical protein